MDRPITERLGGNGNITRESVEETIEAAREKMDQVGRQLMGFVKERPGTALLIAVGAGYLVGRLLRR